MEREGVGFFGRGRKRVPEMTILYIYKECKNYKYI